MSTVTSSDPYQESKREVCQRSDRYPRLLRVAFPISEWILKQPEDAEDSFGPAVLCGWGPWVLSRQKGDVRDREPQLESTNAVEPVKGCYSHFFCDTGHDFGDDQLRNPRDAMPCRLFFGALSLLRFKSPFSPAWHSIHALEQREHRAGTQGALIRYPGHHGLVFPFEHSWLLPNNPPQFCIHSGASPVARNRPTSLWNHSHSLQHIASAA